MYNFGIRSNLLSRSSFLTSCQDKDSNYKP